MHNATKARALWTDLEALGLGELVMTERVRALRAVANASGGPLSVKKSPKKDPAQELARVLKDLLAEDAR